MKFLSIVMFTIIIYYTPTLCMKQKQLSCSGSQKIRLEGLSNSNIVMQLLKKSDYYLKSASHSQSYTLEELHNWCKPLSMVNKKMYNTSQDLFFLRALIASVAYGNDHYNEGDIAQALNTPGARFYIRLCSQLFNTNLTRNDLRIAIKQGADINYRKQYHAGGDTPLVYSVHQKSLNKVHSLLKQGARLDHYTSIDPLSLSIKIGNEPIFNILMAYYNPHKSILYYPLRYALQKYAETDTQDVSSQEKYKKIIKTLLSKNADATEGIIYAIEQGYLYPSLIDIFIHKYNADPNEALKKLVEYVLNNANAQQKRVKAALLIITRSPLFKKEESITALSAYAKRINTLATWIDNQPK